MAVLPNGKGALIEFCESRKTLWTANAVEMGSTVDALDAWTTKVTAARSALTAQQAAQNAAKTSTVTLNEAIADLLDATSDIVKQVKTKAAVDGSVEPYQLADIPVPQQPSPIGPPGTPFEFGAQLMGDGTLKLAWKCNNPQGSQGTIYHVFRQDPDDGTFTFLGANGKKWFIDVTLPAGMPSVTYKIRASRSTAVGNPVQFTVLFGVGAGNQAETSITSVISPVGKIAA